MKTININALGIHILNCLMFMSNQLSFEFCLLYFWHELLFCLAKLNDFASVATKFPYKTGLSVKRAIKIVSLAIRNSGSIASLILWKWVSWHSILRDKQVQNWIAFILQIRPEVDLCKKLSINSKMPRICGIYTVRWPQQLRKNAISRFRWCMNVTKQLLMPRENWSN